MAQSRFRVVEDPDEPAPPPTAPNHGGGNDGRYDRLDERLRVVEGDVREIKTRLEAVATKIDIQRLESSIENFGSRLKIWLLGSSVTALVLVVGWLVTWVVRLMTTP